MVYNFPVVTAGIDLDSDTIATLAQHPNIVGTKLSCGNVGKLHRLTSQTSASEFAVFAGRSDVLLHGLLSGSAGGITALMNVVPKVHFSLYKAYKEGKLEEAMKLQAILGQADWAVQKLGGVGGVKAIVSHAFGYGSGAVRGPLRPVDASVFKGNKYAELVFDLIENQEKKL